MRRTPLLPLLLVVALLTAPAAIAKPAKPAAAAKVPAAPAPPAALSDGTPNLPDAEAWIVIDARDGTQVAGRSPDKRLPIASTTKLMTAYIALQRLKLNQRLSAPKYSATDAESLLGLRVGEKVSVRDLLFALVLESANDAAETLAVGVSGSVDGFVAQMNKEVDALGLPNTHYATPVGLDAPGNYSSARDLVTLAAKLLENPVFAKAADSSTATLKTGDRPRQIGTRNLLLDSYPFITGVKTGHTLDAGYVLVGSGEKDGTTLISAVLGTPSEGARDADTLKLLRYGFTRYKPSTPVETGTSFDGPELDFGRGTLAVEASKPIEVSTREGQNVATAVDIPAEIKGGVEEGEEIGEVRVTVDGRAAGSSPLVAGETVEAAGIFRKGLTAVAGPFVLVPLGVLVIIAGILLAGGHRPHRPHRPHRGQRPSPEGPLPPPDNRSAGGPDPPATGQSEAIAAPGNGSNADNGMAHAEFPAQPRQRGGQRQEKSARTPADRERMRKERMQKRSRKRSPEEGV